MIVTATQIKIKSIVGFLRFLARVRKVNAQLNKADGLVFVKFSGFSTLSGWESYAALKAFCNNGHHLEAMKNINNIGKVRSFTWEALTEPDWKEAKEKLHAVQF